MEQIQSQSTEVDEAVIFELDPLEIKIRKDAPRYRKELGDIDKLVSSIAQFGQLQPIVISRDNELIYGGRRLTACILGGFKAKVCYKDTCDKLLMRELELEENLQRKDFSPSESALAIEEIHTLKQSIHGISTSGKQGVGWGLEKTAALVGKSVGAISDALNIAEMLHAFPELSTAKTASEIKKAYRGLERIQQNMDALLDYEDKVQKTDKFKLVNQDALVWLAELENASIDLVITDPPYAIDIHNNAMTLGRATGGDITANPTYNDTPEYALPLLEKIAIESYRITKADGHAYIFCAPSHFWWLKDRMNSAGWITHERPIVWIKRETGQNNQPEHWPSASYEFILFARKTTSKIILQGRPDWVQVDPVLPSERIHQAEKPLALCKELISRVCLPGSCIVDCCAGSGAIIEAAVDLKMIPLGCEKDIKYYAVAVDRMYKWMEKTK